MHQFELVYKPDKPHSSHWSHPYAASVILLLSDQTWGLAPVPVTIFWSNSKFDQNMQCSGLKYTPLVAMQFCTRHDSYTVVTCAKFHCDRLSIFRITALQNLIELQNRSKCRKWDGRLVIYLLDHMLHNISLGWRRRWLLINIPFFK